MNYQVNPTNNLIQYMLLINYQCFETIFVQCLGIDGKLFLYIPFYLVVVVLMYPTHVFGLTSNTSDFIDLVMLTWPINST
jgi:hypothetical protein